MANKDENSQNGDELRRQAEGRFRETHDRRPSPGPEDDQLRLLHELQVHQIELEIQNTELIETRDNLETLLEKYTDLYDFAPVGYATLDRKGHLLEVNLTVAKLLGIESSRLIGRRFSQFLSTESVSTINALLDRAFTVPAKESCEIVLQKEEHGPLFVQIEALASRSGQECRIAIIDISHRKRMEEKLDILHTELADHAAELEAANIELEAFNSTVSHDLRQPLMLIGCYGQILQDLCDSQIDERFPEYLQKINENIAHMGRRIDFLLRFSSVRYNKMRRETVDLSTMVQILAADLKLMTLERHVRFHIAEGIRVNADPEMCSLVLENVLSNAWKFSVEQAEAVIEFGKTLVNGKPAYFVKDNGPGFTMVEAEKLFKPFERLHESKADGYGIGLATVQRIIQRHGGKVWAESAPGKGATFFFTLE